MAKQRIPLTCGALWLVLALLALSGWPSGQAAAQQETTGETGPNDVRISTMGPEGDTRFYALDPAAAYNPDADEFLVVWAADDQAAPLGDNEFEVYGQRVAIDGTLAGARFRISFTGPDGDAAYYARDPAVAYNPRMAEYLVVWAAGGSAAGLAVDEFEIYGQRLGASGTLLGAAVRISDMGPDGDPAFDALNPAVAYNPKPRGYLVVWQGDDTTDNAVEIYGQRLSGDGTEVGTNDVRLSDMGADDADTACRGQKPAVACGAGNGRCLVVWEGSDDTLPLVAGETEIFGQWLAADGSEIGTNDVRLSDMGPDGSTAFRAADPAVAYSGEINEYLVVWAGEDYRDFGGGLLADGEFEVYGQRVGANGDEVGENDLRISQAGPDGDPAYKAYAAGVASVGPSWLVVWRADGDPPLVDGENEIWTAELDAEGSLLAGPTRLSDMGPDGDPAYTADRPAAAALSSSGTALVVWQGDDNTGTLVEGEVEVFGQLYALENLPNVRPQAVDDAYAPIEDTVLEVSAPGLLANDSDPNGDPLIVQDNTQPAHGTVAVLADGSFTFTPAPNACGLDRFTYTVSDGQGESDTAGVSLDVACVNDPPDAADDSATTTQDTAVLIDATANDIDPDGDLDASSAAVITPPTNGGATANGDGTFTYTPSAGWFGSDGFTYQVCDTTVLCDSAVVVIQVTPALPALHVGDIVLTVQKRAQVPILDGSGVAVRDALVDVTWTLPDGSIVPQSATTNRSGYATFSVRSKLTGVYQVCVTNVSKDGYSYDPLQNVESCDTITVP